MISYEVKRNLHHRLSAARALTSVLPSAERHRHDLTELRAGGFLRLRGEVFRVEALHRYQEGRWYWHELELTSLSSGRIGFIEYEVDDQVAVSVTERELSFRDLRDGNGARIDEDDLEQICRDEDSIFFEEIEYLYEDDYDARFLRRGEGHGEKVWVVEFEGRGGRTLSIEEWEEGEGSYSYQIWLARPENAAAIEIISIKG